MRKNLRAYPCAAIAMLAANFLFGSAAFSQYSAYVTSINVQGNATDQVGVTVSISIYRDPGLNNDTIVLGCNSTPVEPTSGCYSPSFPPGATTWTGTVYFAGTIHNETLQLTAQVSYACQPGCSVDDNLYPDPGKSVPVTVTADTVSAAITPSVVPPSGPSPELTLTVKNGNGTLIHIGGGLQYPTWDCSDSWLATWDYASNSNVTAQTAVPLVQAAFTLPCNVTVTWAAWDGQLTLVPTVTYQQAPNNADLGPSCPRSGAENTCGLPINLTNGNTWTQVDDYQLPGIGGGISLRRTWNSQWSDYTPWIQVGMFGDSWQSNYEKNLQLLSGGAQLRYWRGDGSAWFFTSTKGVWSLSTPADERATLTFSNKTGYTLTLRDASVELYNTNGFLTALKDRNGNQTTLTYDGSNRLTKVTDAAGRVLQFNYGNSGLPNQATSVQDSIGTVASYSYDSLSRLTAVTYADSSVLNYGYDMNGLLLSVTDQLGKVLEAHTYDSIRRGLSSQRANGVDSLTITYYGTGVNGAAHLQDSLGNATNYSAGTRIGNRWYMGAISGTGCDSCAGRNNQSFTYDGAGNRTSSTDPNGNVTNFSYDSNGNVTQISKSIGSATQTSSFTWNSFGEVLTVTDPLGKVTTNTYDTKGNLLTVKTPLGNTTTFTYDTKGELLTIKDPRLNVTTLTYTTAGLIASIKDAQNNLTQFQYDSRGNRIAVIDALNQTTSFTYDSRNRLTKITYATSPATSTQFGYDYRGRRTSATDANGKVTQYAYDDADRLSSVTDAANNVTAYAYDTENNLTQITDASHNSTSFAYDALGRVTKTTFPSNLVESYGYDSNGNLTSRTDRNGKNVTYVFDAANRLTTKTYPDNTTVSYTYDLANHLTQVADATGTYGFTFDADGRLTGTSAAYAFLTGRTFTTSYGYDAAANRTSFTDPEGGSTAYVYDSLNRLQTLTPPVAISSGSFGFTYDALSRRKQLTRPNGVTTSYSYDPVSRLLSVLHQLSGSTIDGAAYTVDNAGNRTSKTDNRTAVTTNYGYDPIYELLSATQGGSTTESYTYDAVGNRLTSLAGSSSYNTSNELTSSPSATLTYDNNGNTLTRTDSTGTTSYAWDFESRLTSVTLPGSAGTVSFKYDPFGRRIYKSSSSGTSVYAYDGENLIEEANSSGTAVARYSQGLNIDEPLAMLRGGASSFYHADGLGTITSLSNTAGSLAQTYTFDSFGKLTTSSGSIINPLQHTGRENDTETGLYYYRSRYYDPVASRFLTEDPIGFIGGVNKYQFVGNRPIVFSDPTGLCPNGVDRKTAVAQCVKQLFGITLKDFTASGKGQNGSFSGETSAGNPISVTNDVTRFTVQDLNTIFYRQAQPPEGRGDIHGLTLSGKTATKWLWGFIPYSFTNFNLSTNYSGSDLPLGDLLTTQVHELGHSLAQMLGLAPIGTEDPYASKLEDCVIQKMLGGGQ